MTFYSIDGLETCPPCPLCSGPSETFLTAQGRDYLLCRTCRLVFVPPRQHLSLAAEKSRYLTHNNDPHDKGYQKFLFPVARAVMDNHNTPSRGLDFGCGTGSPLPGILKEHGFEMNVYDPFFAQHQEVFSTTYDFITCTEVMEHLRDPAGEIAKLWTILNPGGRLYIMTQFRIPEHDFANWAYIRDLTHIAFYSRPTMKWLADFLSAGLSFRDRTVTLLHKNINEWQQQHN